MKILIIHATAGAGHKKAAEAIYNGIMAKTSFEARIIDALDHSNPVFKFSYPNFYTFVVSHIPWLWAFVFGLMDIPALQGVVRFIRRMYNALNTQPLHRLIKEGQYDWIICTQFLSAEVAGYLKRTGQINSKVLCVVTDFDVHRIWINEGVDFYTGACDYTKEKLIALGVPQDRAFVTGIPTDSRFHKEADAPSLRRQLELNDAAVTVLIATGSFGFGPIEELIETLKGHQLIVVCGHNKKLFGHLSKRALPHVKVCGLVSNMDELMAVSDIMVTKPGGLSIAEALVKGLVLVFFSAIPGQETNNVKVLNRFDVGLGLLSLPKINDAVNRLCASASDLKDERERSKAFGKPWAVDDIIRIIRNK